MGNVKLEKTTKACKIKTQGWCNMSIIFTSKGIAIMVDEDDFDCLSETKWCISHYGYAVGMHNKIYTYMHRLILNAPTNLEVDHINRDRIDNRKANLRLCNKSQQQANSVSSKKTKTSKYKGVRWKKDIKKWGASIKHNYKPIGLGVYVSEEDAARAYDKAAKKIFGEFARTNL